MTVEPSLKGSVRVQICWHCSTLLQCHCLHLLRAGLKPTPAIWHPKDHNGQEKQQGMGGWTLQADPVLHFLYFLTRVVELGGFIHHNTMLKVALVGWPRDAYCSVLQGSSWHSHTPLLVATTIVSFSGIPIKGDKVIKAQSCVERQGKCTLQYNEFY